MIGEQASTLGSDQHLDEILADYLRGVEAGQPVEREALLARHPELAGDLADFFADLDRVEEVALPLRAIRQAVGDTSHLDAAMPRTEADTVNEPPPVVAKPDRSKIRCPTCHNPIQLTKESSEVLCPGCGGMFRLCDAAGTDTTSSMRSMGKFQLLERLGLGSFGAVWKAHDTELKRIVALKIPHTGLLTENEELERFQREARAAAQLRHPNIVTVFEVARLNGMPVIVAEFVAGVPLKDLLEVRRLSFRQSAAMILQLADALEYAHSLGVVHRDVKPANVMLLRGQTAHNPAGDAASQSKDELAEIGKPMVLDFGLALRDAGEMTLTVDGHILGTPAYMSPEQARGQSHQADRRSDVYSLGVMLYEMLTRELPFRGSRVMLLDQVLHEEPRPPRKLNDKIPRDLETICLKCLRKEPAKRYATAAELAADLRSFLAGEPIRARRVSAAEQLVRWVRRRPAVAALLVACVVAALGLSAAAAGWAYNQELAEANNRTQAALEKADASAYFHRIGLAEREWWGNNPGRTRALLEEIAQDSPARRGWEWHYLNGVAHSEVMTLSGHLDTLQCAIFSPDGHLLASASRDGTIKIWDANAHKEITTFNQQDNTLLWDLAFSPDGTKLVSASGNSPHCGTVKVWDLAPLLEPAGFGQPKNTILLKEVTGMVCRLAFNRTGDRLAVACGGRSGTQPEVKVLAFPDGPELFSLKTTHDAALAVAFSPDGKRIASGSGGIADQSTNKDYGAVEIWDAKTGAPLHRLGPKGHKGYVNALAFSDDGRLLASAGTDRVIKLWDSQTYQEVAALHGHSADIFSLAFRPAARKGSATKELATADTLGEVKIWNVAEEKELRTLRGHTACVYSLAYDPRGERIVSAGMDGIVRVWDAATDQGVRTLRDHTAAVFGVAFSPKGDLLVSGSLDHTVLLHDVSGEKPPRTLQQLTDAVWCVAFSPDGTKVAAGSGDWQKVKEKGQVTVWDVASGKKLFSRPAHVGLAWSVAFSPDSKRLVSGGGETDSPGDVKIWDAATGKELVSVPLMKGVVHVASSPDGTRVAGAAFHEGVVKIWDANTLKEQLELPLGLDFPWSLAFGPDGKQLFTGGTKQSVKIWDTTGDGKLLATLPGHADDVRGLAINAFANRAVSASSDQTLRLWDLAARQEVLTLRGHTAYVNAVAFSRAGDLIASASNDGTVKIWDGRPRDKK